jgi:hypothetical protein
MDIFDLINTLYGKDYHIIKKGFFKNYGAQLFIAIIIIYIFLTAIMYFYVMNHIPNIKANWSTEKCNPLYMPFAGFVINDTRKSNMEIAAENFAGCMNNILVSMASHALSPIYSTLSIATTVMHLINEAINSIRAFFNKIRNSIKEISSDISDRTLGITTSLMEFFIAIKDTMSKITGVFTTTLYTLFASFLTLESLIMFIVNIGEVILVLGLAMLVMISASSLIPFFGIPFIPMLILGKISYAMIITLFLLVVTIEGQALHTSETAKYMEATAEGITAALLP